MNKRQVGAIEIARLLELEEPFRLPSEFFPEASDEALAPHRHWLEPKAICPQTGKLILPVQSYLVRTQHHTILIDTCIGCGKSYDGIPGWKDRRDEAWLQRLQAAGVQPEAIGYVFCTHLHVDHCGWNTRFVDGRWVPTFPNAKYVFARPEYEASEAANTSVYKENIQPIMEAGQADLVDLDFALDDEVWLEPTTGHTKGHVAVHLASNGDRAVMCGDLIHSPIQCVYPTWSTRVDSDPDRARATRQRFLEQHSDTDTLVMTAHFPSPSMGHVVGKDAAFFFEYVA